MPEGLEAGNYLMDAMNLCAFVVVVIIRRSLQLSSEHRLYEISEKRLLCLDYHSDYAKVLSIRGLIRL